MPNPNDPFNVEYLREMLNVVGAEESQEETWSSSDGKIQLHMTMEQAQSVSHSGECDEDVDALKQDSGIAAQLEQLDPETVARELSDYWSDDELTDPTENLSRLLWLAGGDIVEEKHEKEKHEKQDADAIIAHGLGVDLTR